MSTRRRGKKTEARKGTLLIKLVKPVLCPACGFRMEKGQVRIGEFRCPGCGGLLESDTRLVLPIALISLPLGVLITYLTGLSGMGFVLAALILSFVISCAGNFITAFLRPRLTLRRPVYGLDFRITGPPDAPKKDGRE